MEIIDELENLINREMNNAHSYYSSHLVVPRITFRILGIITLGLSVTIPFISQADFTLENKSLWITGLSLSITAVTGISTFFKPDEIWKLNMGAKLNLESLFAAWQLDCLEAKSLSTEDEIIKRHIEASRKFLNSAKAVTSANTEGFFANINLPESK